MHAVSYESDELKLLYRVLQGALRFDRPSARSMSLQDMTNRLFAAADTGERDPAKLRAAIFGGEAKRVKRRKSQSSR